LISAIRNTAGHYGKRISLTRLLTVPSDLLMMSAFEIYLLTYILLLTGLNVAPPPRNIVSCFGDASFRPITYTILVVEWDVKL